MSDLEEKADALKQKGNEKFKGMSLSLDDFFLFSADFPSTSTFAFFVFECIYILTFVHFEKAHLTRSIYIYRFKIKHSFFLFFTLFF